jgi:hypothetical protein
MKISRTLSIALAVGVLATTAGADVTVVQTATIDNPQLKAMMQSLSPEQKAQMAQFGMGSTITSKSYIKGTKSRTDVGKITSVIVDSATGKMISLNRVSHTYSTQPLNAKAGRGTKISLKATGKTKTILGHLCRDYKLNMTSPAASGAMTITGDVWAAPDLPRLAAPPLGASGPAAAIAAQWGKIAGMPLQAVMVIGGSPMGRTTVRTMVHSVATTPLSASVFAIPAGYKPGPAGMMPGMGGIGR